MVVYYFDSARNQWLHISIRLSFSIYLNLSLSGTVFICLFVRGTTALSEPPLRPENLSPEEEEAGMLPPDFSQFIPTMGFTKLAPMRNFSYVSSRRTIHGFASGLFVSLLVLYLLFFAGGSDKPTDFAVLSPSNPLFWFLPASRNISGWLKPTSLSPRNQSLSDGGNRRLHRGCDIFSGRWIRDDTMPFYDPASCPFVDPTFDCHVNGRPDKEFLKWRWQPNDCDIPRLKATDFLERLRDQRLVFVGDSLNRNMWESLVCILRGGVDGSKVHQEAGKSDLRASDHISFRFEDYNCSVELMRAPFLVREVHAKGADGERLARLRLDLMEKGAESYREADIIVFNTGHWWNHYKTKQGVDYFQEGDHVYPFLPGKDAYKKALSTWASWVDKNINPNKTQVFYRAVSPAHFRGGLWNTGGHCHGETEPIFNETYLTKKSPPLMKPLRPLFDQMKTPVVFLNITRLTDYRKDAHPSIYRKKYASEMEKVDAVATQDCSHWCLPGVPDTWNELLYASLLMVGEGSWKS